MKNSANTPLRVLEVSKSTGGLGTYMRWLADGFDSARFALTFACLSEDAAALADALSRRGWRALAWPMERYRLNPLTDAAVVWRLARLIRRERFDLIHAHGSKAGFLVRLAAIGSGVPVCYSPHHFAFHPGQPRLSSSLFAFVEKIAARFLTAKIITVSDSERETARRFGVGQETQFVTVHSGVDPANFPRRAAAPQQKAALGVPPDAPLVGALGRLSPQKNPLDFVRLAARVHAARPDVHFVWIGAGPLEAEARALTAELGVQDCVHFPGPRSDIPAQLRALDVFVMTSRWEAFSLALLEAMASALPVASYRLDGIAEAVTDGREGLLVPCGDVDGLSAAVLRLLNDRALASQLGDSARLRVEQDFTRTKMIEALAKIYDCTAKRSLHREDR